MQIPITTTTTTSKPSSSTTNSQLIPEDYYILLVNVALILSSGFEFLCSAISSYKSARLLCSCFKNDNNNDDNVKGDYYTTNSHAIVSSWLGKHSPTPALYVVAAPAAGAPPTSVGSRSKVRVIIVFINFLFTWAELFTIFL